MTDKTLAVVLNWRRPGNLPRILDALRSQTVPLTIALVECSPDTQFALAADVRARADICFSVNHNIGPCSRFIPPLALPEFRYTFFGVDDHAPGRRHIEWLLQCAEDFRAKTGDNLGYATIGQDGRLIRDGAIVRRKIKMQPIVPTPVDFITSSELVPTIRVREALTFRDALLQDYGTDQISTFEDDLFLCAGAQVRCRQLTGDDTPCYLTPEPPSKDESWRAARLPSPHALCARTDHHERRDRWIRLAIDAGWRPPTQLLAAENQGV